MNRRRAGILPLAAAAVAAACAHTSTPPEASPPGSLEPLAEQVETERLSREEYVIDGLIP